MNFHSPSNFNTNDWLNNVLGGVLSSYTTDIFACVYSAQKPIISDHN